MGRYNFTASRVHKNVTMLLKSEHLRDTPAWYETIGQIPPSEILTRPQPMQLRELPPRLQNKKPSKMFKPQQIVFPEDKLRMNFYKHHPWELARPRIILEEDGKDGQKVDWSRMDQPGRQLNGESVVQRQLWLLNKEGKTSAEAYDQARQEFYALRHQQEIEQRVAKEEALSTGAYFGMSAIDVGMQLEDHEYERWKEWATKNVQTVAQRRAASAATLTPMDETSDLEDSDIEVDNDLLTPEAVEEK